VKPQKKETATKIQRYKDNEYYTVLRALLGTEHWFMPVILATWETQIGRTVSLRPAQANSSQDTISKITRAKWINGLEVRSLLCKKKKKIQTLG
jgi:hypothetical protein